MAKKTKLKDWLDYLESRVGIDVYVWCGNGELIVTLLPKLVDMEKSDHTEKEALKNLDRLNTLLQKRLYQEVDIYSIRGEDCSGLSVKYLLDNALITSDKNCNGLWELFTKKGYGKEIKLSEVKAGDYLFDGSTSNKWHVGYAVSKKYAVECQNHDLGVVKTVISERSWKYACRPNWYEDSKPEQPVLTRELYYTSPMLKGEDVKEVQEHLNDRGYNCGSVDGVFGKKCDIATRNFQTDNNLTVDGIIGEKTAIALGFKWEG